MPASKMAVFATFMTLFGIFAAGVLGVAPTAVYSNGVSTETAAPQELGSTTYAGSLVYSFNVCTIVHSTNCATSTSTGGAAPPTAQASISPVAYGSEPGYPNGSVSATPGASKPVTSKTGEPVPTIHATTNSVGSSIAVTQVETSAGKATGSGPIKSKEQQPTGSTGMPVPTSTGASNTIGAFRGVAFGITVMALVFLS